MKILFVCKYNRFRSKVAEVYFKKINKNKKIKVKSQGIIEVNKSLDPAERRRNKYLLKKFKFKLKGKSKSINVKSLIEANKIIIVADDIPREIFNSKKWKKKIQTWKIPDENADNEKNIDKIVGNIIKKVNNLAKELKNEK
jgi:protein-tyrosine-phosphatase